MAAGPGAKRGEGQMPVLERRAVAQRAWLARQDLTAIRHQEGLLFLEHLHTVLPLIVGCGRRQASGPAVGASRDSSGTWRGTRSGQPPSASALAFAIAAGLQTALSDFSSREHPAILHCSPNADVSELVGADFRRIVFQDGEVVALAAFDGTDLTVELSGP